MAQLPADTIENRAQQRQAYKVRTAADLLRSLSDPVGHDGLIRSILDGETLGETFTWARILRMRPEEHKRLMDDLHAFPCDSGTKDILLKRIALHGPQHPLREQLERIVSSGRYSVTQNPMLDWAALEPKAALDWYRSKRASGAFTSGIDQKLNLAVMTDLLRGLARSNPNMALELYRSTSRAEMHEWTPMWLASEFAMHMLQTGKATMLLELMEVQGGEHSKQVLQGAMSAYGRSGKFSEGLEFVTRFDRSPEAQMDYLGHLFSYGLAYHQVRGGLDWLRTLSMESQRPELVGEIIAHHLSGGGGIKELEAEDWLSSQPMGVIRDKGYAALSDARLHVKLFERAMHHATSIDDKTLREAKFEKIKQRWMEHDPEEARLRLAKGVSDPMASALSAKNGKQETAKARKGDQVDGVETAVGTPASRHVERVCKILTDLKPVSSELKAEDPWMQIVLKDKAYKAVFVNFLQAVEKLQVEDLLAVAKKTTSKEFKKWLVILAAEQDPMRIFREDALKNAISPVEMYDAIARKDSGAAIGLLPPMQPRSPGKDSVYLVMEPYLAAWIRVATKLLADDLNEGLKAFLQIQDNLKGANRGRIPMGLFGALGTPAIPGESLPGLIEAVGKGEYARIKPDLIAMTVTHAMFHGGVTSATQYVESMRLHSGDLGDAISCMIKNGGLDTQPVALANWVSRVQPKNIASILRDWSETDIEAAVMWLSDQKNAFDWAQAVHDDELKNELLKRLSGE